MNEAILMDEPKQKLAMLEKLLPNSAEQIHSFGRFLVEYLNKELTPEGFVIGCELALYDLQKGVNGFTNEPIKSKLVGYPPMIYAMFRLYIPQIAEAIFSAEFAESVKTFFVGEVKK